MSFFNPQTKAFGLQIGDVALRAVELKKAGGKHAVQAASEVMLPKGVIRDDAITDIALLASHIERLVERPSFGRFTTKNVVVNLPESKCFVRVIHMQHMKDGEIENAIPFEAESYIPIPIDQVYLDWQKLSETNGRMEILLIASAKEYVDKVVSALETAHLVPVALEVESQSLARIIVSEGSNENSIIANIQSARTDLVLIERGNIQFTSTIPLGGNAITDSIARGLGITPQAAESIKQQVGIANTTEYPNLKTIIVPVLASFVSEVKNTLNFHAQHSTERVTNVVLAGGGAQLKHIEELLATELASEGVAVKIADISRVIEIPTKDNVQTFAPLGYSTAFGLAVRPID